MKIFEFWVVTKPKGLGTTLEDICFRANIKSLELQLLGGLKPDDVVATYTEQEEATKAAQKLLSIGLEYFKEVEYLGANRE